jgi:hypothetical protein
MRPTLVSRILFSIAGAATGLLFCREIAVALSTVPNLGKAASDILLNLLFPYFFGTGILIVVNLADTNRQFPRDYWFFGGQRDRVMSIGACFGFGVLAPFYILVVVSGYIRNVIDRSTIV